MKTRFAGIEIFTKQKGFFLNDWLAGINAQLTFDSELERISDYKNLFSRLENDNEKLELMRKYFRIFKNSPHRFYSLSFGRAEYALIEDERRIELGVNVSSADKGGRLVFSTKLNDPGNFRQALESVETSQFSDYTKLPSNYGLIEKALDLQFFKEDCVSFISGEKEFSDAMNNVLGRAFERELILPGEFSDISRSPVMARDDGVIISQMRSRKLGENATYYENASAEVLKTFDSFGLYTQNFYDGAEGRFTVDGKIVALYGKGGFEVDEFNLPQLLSRTIVLAFGPVSSDQTLKLQDKLSNVPKFKELAVIPSEPVVFGNTETGIYSVNLQITPDYGWYCNAANGNRYFQEQFSEASQQLERFVLSI